MSDAGMARINGQLATALHFSENSADPTKAVTLHYTRGPTDVLLVRVPWDQLEDMVGEHNAATIKEELGQKAIEGAGGGVLKGTLEGDRLFYHEASISASSPLAPPQPENVIQLPSAGSAPASTDLKEVAKPSVAAYETVDAGVATTPPAHTAHNAHTTHTTQAATPIRKVEPKANERRPRHIGYAIGILAILVLGIGSWRMYFRGDHASSATTADTTEVGNAASQETTGAPTPEASKPAPSPPANVAGDAFGAGSFPVSASVQKLCQQPAGCEGLKAALREVEHEPRDSGWATDMEKDLKEYAQSLGSNKYTVRSVECRTSLCAIEVAFLADLLPFALPHDSPLGSRLSATESWTGKEINQLGAAVTVMLSIYRRQ